MRLIILATILIHGATSQDYGNRNSNNNNNSHTRVAKQIPRQPLLGLAHIPASIRVTSVKATVPGRNNAEITGRSLLPNSNQQGNQPFQINGLVEQNTQNFPKSATISVQTNRNNFQAQGTQNNGIAQQSFQQQSNSNTQTRFQASGNFQQNRSTTQRQGSFSAALPSIPRSRSGPGARLEIAIEDGWNNFKRQFNKVYSTPAEETFRREIFIENTRKIERFNQDYSSGKSTFVQQINEYADMLHHEFNTNLNGFNRTSQNQQNVIQIPKASFFIPSANVQIPDQIDWRELGAVTPVKSQGLCGACYAFSAAGAIEGHNFRKTGVLTELSPQNLIDCTKPYGNDGCLGGLMDPAFQYVKDNPGIDTESSYPYESSDGPSCRYKTEGFGAEDTGFVDIPSGDENALKVAVATLGPVSIALDASQDSLQFYSDGIYFDEKCKNEVENMNHAALIVGYGTEPDGKEYWLIKNSYGSVWGIGGYIKMARNADNHCGIASIASYPLV